MSQLDRRSALLTLASAALPAPAFASDPWEKEPSQWSEKDLQKIMTDSPWSRTVSVSIGGPSVGDMGGGRAGRGSRGGGGGGAMADASSGSMGGEGGGMGGRGGMGGGGGTGGGEGMSGGGLAPSMTFLIRWQSAKPIKLASVRANMGAEADTSPKAKEFVERRETECVIAVIMPGMRMPGEDRSGAPQGERKAPPEDSAEKLKETCWLSWKGHEQVHPTSVAMPRTGASAFVFHFSKRHPIEIEDKEVEFAMRCGRIEVKKKFRLKDMVFQGQLAL